MSRAPIQEMEKSIRITDSMLKQTNKHSISQGGIFLLFFENKTGESRVPILAPKPRWKKKWALIPSYSLSLCPPVHANGEERRKRKGEKNPQRNSSPQEQEICLLAPGQKSPPPPLHPLSEKEPRSAVPITSGGGSLWLDREKREFFIMQWSWKIPHIDQLNYPIPISSKLVLIKKIWTTDLALKETKERLHGIQSGCSLGTDAERTGGRGGKGKEEEGSFVCGRDTHQKAHTQTDRRGI